MPRLEVTNTTVFDQEQFPTTNDDYFIVQNGWINVGTAEYISLWIKATSDSTDDNDVDCTCIIMCSPMPVEEYFVEAEEHENLIISDELPHMTYLSVPITRYIKLKIVDDEENSYPCKITAIIQYK